MGEMNKSGVPPPAALPIGEAFKIKQQQSNGRELTFINLLSKCQIIKRKTILINYMQVD